MVLKRINKRCGRVSPCRVARQKTEWFARLVWGWLNEFAIVGPFSSEDEAKHAWDRWAWRQFASGQWPDDSDIEPDYFFPEDTANLEAAWDEHFPGERHFLTILWGEYNKTDLRERQEDNVARFDRNYCTRFSSRLTPKFTSFSCGRAIQVDASPVGALWSEAKAYD